MRHNTKALRQIILAAMLTAMGIVLTYCLKIPTHAGYIHIGDGIIFLAACLLPTPVAMLCCGLTGMLADLLGGYTLYAIPSFFIKALLTIAFDRKSEKIITKRNIIALLIGGLITIGGYFAADGIVLSLSSGSDIFATTTWLGALMNVPANLIQIAASSILFITLSTALDKIKLKSKLTEEK